MVTRNLGAGAREGLMRAGKPAPLRRSISAAPDSPAVGFGYGKPKESKAQ